ncbi:MAG: acetyl-CoA carboxylase, partial [Verrucomicrobia bacterium]|nr:acetyl-CoA carboxylase [Verrucomicrobiota bacterium]
MDLKDIKAVIDLMKKNAITEFELEKQEFKIKLKRGGNGGPAVQAYDDQPAVMISGAPVAALPAAASAGAAPAVSNDLDIKSPMIGTFYRAPSPESASYVEIGTEVNPDSVVCIIEAMKV